MWGQVGVVCTRQRAGGPPSWKPPCVLGLPHYDLFKFMIKWVMSLEQSGRQGGWAGDGAARGMEGRLGSLGGATTWAACFLSLPAHSLVLGVQ